MTRRKVLKWPFIQHIQRSNTNSQGSLNMIKLTFEFYGVFKTFCNSFQNLCQSRAFNLIPERINMIKLSPANIVISQKELQI